MAAFDELPPLIRRRLADAPNNIAAAPLRDFWLSETGDCVERFTAIQSALDDARVAA